jgi:hypothetical protein
VECLFRGLRNSAGCCPKTARSHEVDPTLGVADVPPAASDDWSVSTRLRSSSLVFACSRHGLSRFQPDLRGVPEPGVRSDREDHFGDARFLVSSSECLCNAGLRCGKPQLHPASHEIHSDRPSAVQIRLRLLPARKRTIGRRLPNRRITFRPRGFPPPRRFTPHSGLECVATRDGHGVRSVSAVLSILPGPKTYQGWESHRFLATGFTPLEESPSSVAVPHHCGRYPPDVGSPSTRSEERAATNQLPREPKRAAVVRAPPP